MARAPLSGVKVLDLSRILAGPYCTQMLADLGADVVKVEPPDGDDTRRFGPPFVEGESTYFMSANRGKRSIVIDLKNPNGLAVVHDLAAWADVAVENFRPGVADKLGVGYEALSAINPRLIYASISGYGHRGAEPYTRLPGYDLVIQGIGGIPSLTGPTGGAPYKMGTSVADLVAGSNAFAGVTTALFDRERTGCGRKIDISMLDGQLSLLSYHAGASLNAGAAPARLGNAHPSICPYETLAAADGFVNVACGNDALFCKLCDLLGVPALATEVAFATNADRVQNRTALLERLTPLFASRPVAEWTERLQAAGVPCGPILSVPDALAHPQAAARGTIVEQEHPRAGMVRGVGCPAGFERATFTDRPPPGLGEHADDILRDLLGYGDERRQALRATGALGPR
jgi:crotonobetainyl-CoA:carnitine CoA-transferase CaiB-like acyl-CoA transferase